MSTASSATAITSANPNLKVQRRPKDLARIAAVLVLAGLSFPIQVVLQYGYSPLELEAILVSLAPMNWVVMALALIHAYCVFHASKWVITTGASFLIAVIWNNWLVAVAGLNAPTPTIVLTTIAAALIHLPLFRGEIPKFILNPHLRWWRTPARKTATIRATIRPVLGGEFSSETFDISMGGAFISTDKSAWTAIHDAPKENMKTGARCSIRLVFDPYTVLHCGARIVRHATPKGGYPQGFAVRFIHLNKNQKKLLSSFINRPEELAQAQWARERKQEREHFKKAA